MFLKSIPALKNVTFSKCSHSKTVFSCTYPITDNASTPWDSASYKHIRNPCKYPSASPEINLSKIHIFDYKVLDVLPLKLQLEFNRGIIMHKILNGYL